MSSAVMIGGAVGYALVICIALVLRPRMAPGYMGRAFRRSASMRLGSGSILLGLIVTFVLGGLLGTAGAVIGVALLVIGWAAAALLNDDLKTHCEACGKRAKLGASVCHHCARKL